MIRSKLNMLFLLFLTSILEASQPYALLFTKEKVVAVIDRSVYIAGEKVLFSANVLSISGSHQAVANSVLYCEIISPDGFRIAGNKFPVWQGYAEGCIEIPGDITTGNYYFRAYTKMMRADGPGTYHYSRLKIINAVKNDVLSGNNPTEPIDSLAIAPQSKEPSPEFEMLIGKKAYAPRDTVQLKIIGNTGSLQSLSIAIVPEAAAPNDSYNQPAGSASTNNEGYYPEDHGISLSGTLLDADGGNPLPGTRVNLSLIGKGKDFIATQTDSSGRFFLLLPDYTGKRDVFICSENLPGINTKILVDNDFCTLPVRLPSPVFSLTEKEKATAYKMAVNRQIFSAFTRDTSTIYLPANSSERPFYGNPSDILYLDQFIQLPTLEEYFNELPSWVKVRQHSGEKYFKVYGTRSELDIYDPLVMVDWVAIDDPEKILGIPPQLVARIEVVNIPYVKGDQTYGGIISIVTKKGDFAGIDLPSSGIFINYQLFKDNKECEIFQPVLPGIPDPRNTVYWQPRLVTNRIPSQDMSFTVPDTPGKYLAILRGITSEGKIIKKLVGFEVIL